MQPLILIIDDEEKLQGLLKRIISLEGFDVVTASTLGSGMQLLEKRNIDVVLCDVKLPDGNGIDFTKTIKEKFPDVEVILLTAYGNITGGVQAIKNGAFDYIVKGDDNDKIIPLLNRAVETVQLKTKVNRLQTQLDKKYGFDTIVGESPVIKAQIELAKKVAPTEAPVLLTGETGTGKEVFAQSIHYNSARKDHSFVALNCSALSKDIIESELFGYRAGAFTGAAKDKKGLIAEANGGTLFLDEIGEMPVDLQPKLLRFLEDGIYYRVGDSTPAKADVRLIAATNRDLKKEIEAGNFRSDLFYRIAVFSMQLPSLRERKKDIILLAEHFLRKYQAKAAKKITSISKEAAQALMDHPWPGNIRELKNVIERAVILEDSNVLTIHSLPYELQQAAAASTSENPSAVFHLSTIEKQHIRKVLDYTHGNKAEAARLLDIGLATLYRKIEEYGMKQ